MTARSVYELKLGCHFSLRPVLGGEGIVLGLMRLSIAVLATVAPFLAIQLIIAVVHGRFL
jgi:hypothetical protein